MGPISVTVKVPTQLRSLLDGSVEIVCSGSTVEEVLQSLEALNPELRERLRSDQGELRRFINVYVEDEDIRFLDGLSTAIPHGGVVAIIPAVAGG